MVLVFSAIIFLAALYYTLSPLKSGREAWLERENPADVRLDALEARKKIFLKALKDIEFEHASGKINESDYSDLRNHYRREVSTILSEIKNLGVENPDVPDSGYTKDDEPRDDYPEVENHVDANELYELDDDHDEDAYDENEEDYSAPVKPRTREREIRLIRDRKGIVLALAGISLALAGVLFFATSQKKTGNVNPRPASGYRPEPATAPLPTEAGLNKLIEYVRENPWNVIALSTLGGYYLDHDQPMKALGLLKRAEQNNPENSSVLHQLGMLYREVGDVDLAVEKLEKARELTPDNPELILHLAQTYLNDEKNSHKALQLFRRVLAKDPDGDLGKAARVEIKKLGG